MKVFTDLSVLNDKLYSLTEAEQRDRAESKMDSIESMLLTLISTTKSPDQVAIFKQVLPEHADSLKGAAEFKRIRLNLAMDKRDGEISPKFSKTMRADMTELKTISPSRIELAHGARYVGLEHAKYRGGQVLVEWRTAEGPMFAQLRRPMQRLALLLVCADASFAALKCLGLLEMKEKGRFGMVYALPVVPGLIPYEQVTVTSLRDLMVLVPRMNLNSRVKIADLVADAVIQLHTAGWLHKSIRPDNIIFASTDKDDPVAVLARRPHLIGYDLARPDTSEAAGTLTVTPNTTLSADLYRHREKRGGWFRSYRKADDLYALGCVLIELVTWKPLVEVFSSAERVDWKRRLDEAQAAKQSLPLPSMVESAYGPIVQRAPVRREIEHTTGRLFYEAIALCFEAEGASEGDEISMTRQTRIVETLKACRV
jgi:hypothetical protein